MIRKTTNSMPRIDITIAIKIPPCCVTTISLTQRDPIMTKTIDVIVIITPHNPI